MKYKEQGNAIITMAYMFSFSVNNFSTIDRMYGVKSGISFFNCNNYFR
jgi:hypothetical protein